MSGTMRGSSARPGARPRSSHRGVLHPFGVGPGDAELRRRAVVATLADAAASIAVMRIVAAALVTIGEAIRLRDRRDGFAAARRLGDARSLPTAY
jgi:hypothetical protein